MRRFPALVVVPLVLLATAGCGGSGPSNVPVLKAGGSTFVYPAMAKWAQEYRTLKNVEVSYQSIGSGAGIHGMLDKTFDFGCTDAPMDEAELKKARAAGGDVVHIPLLLGAVVPAYNLPEVRGDLDVHGRSPGRHLPGQDQEVERRRPPEPQPRGQAAGPGHHRGPPPGCQRHDLHLGGLPVQGQPGVEGQGRRRHRPLLAVRPGREGQRRACPAASTTRTAASAISS